jgi:hypothetical protein
MDHIYPIVFPWLNLGLGGVERILVKGQPILYLVAFLQFPYLKGGGLSPDKRFPRGGAKKII